MNNLNFGIITPSYAPDYERCRLLSQSIRKFVSSPYTHYIIVAQSDFQLFKGLAGDNTKVLIVESILPKWIKREPIFKKVWLSLKGLPIRNWLLQQIVKIATAQFITEELIIFADSDVAFVKPCDLSSLLRQEQLRLYCDPVGNPTQKQMHQKWHESAAKLLNIESDPTIPDFIGQVVTWRRSNVVSLCQHVENVSGQCWINAIANTWHFSEYVLYGLYVTQILKESSGHYLDPQTICHDYWDPKPLSDEEIREFIKTVEPHQFAIMISAKAGISVQQYQAMLRDAS